MAVSSLVKQPGESRLYTMDFSALLGVGETITGVSSVVAAPAGLSLDGAAIANGAFAQQRISSGAAGTQYRLTFTVTTSLGNTLEGDGILQVKQL